MSTASETARSRRAFAFRAAIAPTQRHGWRVCGSLVRGLVWISRCSRPRARGRAEAANERCPTCRDCGRALHQEIRTGAALRQDTT
jgi:hypothetical protein